MQKGLELVDFVDSGLQRVAEGAAEDGGGCRRWRGLNPGCLGVPVTPVLSFHRPCKPQPCTERVPDAQPALRLPGRVSPHDVARKLSRPLHFQCGVLL